MDVFSPRRLPGNKPGGAGNPRTQSVSTAVGGGDNVCVSI